MDATQDGGMDGYRAKVARCSKLKPSEFIQPLTPCFKEDLCESMPDYCPVNIEEAVSLACFAGSSTYTTYCNDCGGLTISTPDDGSQLLVHLDANERFVGVTVIYRPIDGEIEIEGCAPARPQVLTRGSHCEPIEPAGAEPYIPCTQGSAGKPPFRR